MKIIQHLKLKHKYKSKYNSLQTSIQAAALVGLLGYSRESGRVLNETSSIIEKESKKLKQLPNYYKNECLEFGIKPSQQFIYSISNQIIRPII